MPSTPRPYFDEEGRTDAETYLMGALDGTHVVGATIKALARKMLPRIREGYRRWHFSPEHALRPVRFIETFCRIPSAENMGKPFLLEPYERMIVELAFGFVDDEGYRQFQEVIVEVARKCGKTSLLAALNSYMLTSDGENAAECYNGATTTSQARLCYGATNDMIKMSPQLRKRIRRGMVHKRGISGLNYDAKNSYLCTISSRSDNLDGLNMHFGVLDELAASKDGGATYRLLKGSMGSRKQPMLFIISTNGHVRNGIWDTRIAYAKSWLDGNVDDDRILPILYEMDSREEIYDEAMWPKANPGLGTVKRWEYLRDAVNTAKQDPSDMPELLTKQFNIPANSYSSFLTYDESVNNEDFELDPNEFPYCVVGFDLADRGDLNAAVALMRRPGDDRIYEKAMFWIAEEQVKINSNSFKERDAVPYHAWASAPEHWLDIVEGDKVNQRVILEWMRQELVDNGIYPYAVCYDSWHVDDYLEHQLQRACGESRVKPVPQNAKALSPLMKEHRLDLRAHRIICPNPIIHWCRSNVQVKTDYNDNVFPRKKELRPQNRIDGYMAELFALAAFKRYEEEYLAAIGWVEPE